MFLPSHGRIPTEEFTFIPLNASMHQRLPEPSGDVVSTMNVRSKTDEGGHDGTEVELDVGVLVGKRVGLGVGLAVGYALGDVLGTTDG